MIHQNNLNVSKNGSHIKHSRIHFLLHFLKSIFASDGRVKWKWVYLAQRIGPVAIDVLIFSCVIMKLDRFWRILKRRAIGISDLNELKDLTIVKEDHTTKNTRKENHTTKSTGKEDQFFNQDGQKQAKENIKKGKDDIGYMDDNCMKKDDQHKKEYQHMNVFNNDVTMDQGMHVQEKNSNEREKESVLVNELSQSNGIIKGEHTIDAALKSGKVGVLTYSPGRVDQLRERLKRDFDRYCNVEALEQENEPSIRKWRIASLIRLGFLIGRVDRLVEQYTEGVVWILYHLVCEYIFSQSLGEFLYFSIFDEVLKAVGLSPGDEIGGIARKFASKKGNLELEGIASHTSKPTKSYHILGSSGRRVRAMKNGGSYEHQRKVKLLLKFFITVLIQWSTNFSYDAGVLNAVTRLVLKSKSKAEKWLYGVDFISPEGTALIQTTMEWINTFIAYMINELQILHSEGQFINSELAVPPEYSKATAPHVSGLHNGHTSDTELEEFETSNTGNPINDTDNSSVTHLNPPSSQYPDQSSVKSNEGKSNPQNDANSEASFVLVQFTTRTLHDIQQWCNENINSNPHALDTVRNDLQLLQSCVQRKNMTEIREFVINLQRKYHGKRFPLYGILAWWNPSSILIGLVMNRGRQVIRFMLRFFFSILYTKLHDTTFHWMYD